MQAKSGGVVKSNSIDILKFFAAVLVLNSHMNWAYGSYRALATGGAIGDVLFFFCSGYTLFLGRLGSFDTWYKRRIRRIYPSLFGFALVGYLFLNQRITVGSLALSGGGNWFISCIMIYYVLLYFIRRYFMNRLYHVYSFACIIVLLWYLLLFKDKDTIYMYKETYFKWCHYFLFMLIGAIIGSQQRDNLKHSSPIKAFVGLLVSLILFYGIQMIGMKSVIVANAQIVTLIPLMGIVYSLYILSMTKFIQMIYNNQYCKSVILFVGGLCLELYICQMPVLTGTVGVLPFGYYRDDLLPYFPFNVVLLVLVVFFLAYLTRAVGRFFIQTFDSVEGYQWKKVFSLI